MVQPRGSHRPPLRPVSEAYTAVTGVAYTAKAGDRVIGVNRAGIVTITLPTAQVRPGRIYTIKDESGAAATNNITVATEGSETIDGSATDVINVNYESKSYYSDGTNWFILPVTPDTNTQLTLATTVSTQAHGDSSAGGSATTASKGDHKHGMPASGGGSDISAQAYHSVDQSIAHAAYAILSLNSERFDTDTIHDTVTNNSRLTCKTAGVYLIVAYVLFNLPASPAGIRQLFIRKNGATPYIAMTSALVLTGDHHQMSLATIQELAVNDYVEITVRHTQGASLNLLASNKAPELSMAKILG